MRVLVIGGSGTIGRAVVGSLARRHDVLTCGRTTCEYAVDIGSADSIRRLFETTGRVDAVVCAAGDVIFKPMEEMTDDDYAVGIANKLMGQANVVRIGHPHLRDRGSFTLTSGVTGRRPIPGCTSVAMVNAAVEGFVRATSLELPRGLRINAVSPQWTTETLTLYGMDPAWGVPASQVIGGYIESVEGTRTGSVIDAGWRFDWTADAISVAAPRPEGPRVAAAQPSSRAMRG